MRLEKVVGALRHETLAVRQDRGSNESTSQRHGATTRRPSRTVSNGGILPTDAKRTSRGTRSAAKTGRDCPTTSGPDVLKICARTWTEAVSVPRGTPPNQRIRISGFAPTTAAWGKRHVKAGFRVSARRTHRDAIVFAQWQGFTIFGMDTVIHLDTCFLIRALVRRRCLRPPRVPLPRQSICPRDLPTPPRSPIRCH